jgi:hypothetical protein
MAATAAVDSDSDRARAARRLHEVVFVLSELQYSYFNYQIVPTLYYYLCVKHGSICERNERNVCGHHLRNIAGQGRSPKVATGDSAP